jgi:hypothetical protein
MWEGLHDARGRLWPPAEHLLGDVSLHTMLGAQRACSRHVATQRCAACLAFCDTTADLVKHMLWRLGSSACQVSMSWRMALPQTCAFELKDVEFRAMQHGPGDSLLPASAVGPWCCCVGASGDVLLTLESGMTVADASVMQPPEQPIEQPQLPHQSSSSKARCQKVLRLQLACIQWVPLGTLFCGSLWPVGQACCRFPRSEAAAAGTVSKSSFVASALREFSAGSCKGNYLMHRASLGVLAGVAGPDLWPGADWPSEADCD